MAFDPDEYLGLKPRGGVKFKDADVEQEFGAVNPELKSIFEKSPTPVTVTSGRRGLVQNASVGGVPNSYHTTGDAVDVRLGELNPSLHSNLTASGYEVIPEDDHYHIEPSKNKPKFQQAAFDPDAYLASGDTEGAPQVEKPKKGLFDTIGGMARAAGRSAANSATAGILEPAAAGISALVDEGLQATGKVPERSLGESYDAYRSKQARDVAADREENPGSAIVGDIGGILAPGGAFNLATKAAGNVTKTAAPLISKVPTLFGKKAAEIGLKGGLANAAYQGLNPEVETESLPADFAIGAAGDLVGAGVGKGIGAAYKGAKKLFGRLAKSPNLAPTIEGLLPVAGKILRGKRELAEGEARDLFGKEMISYKANEAARKAKYDSDIFEEMSKFDAQEAARRNKYDIEKKDAVEGFKGLIKKDPVSAAESLFGKVKQRNIQTGKDFATVVDPIMERYGAQAVDGTPVLSKIDSMLNQYGVLDDTGALRADWDTRVLAPETKKLVDGLLKARNAFTEGLNVKRANQLVRELQTMADFSSGEGFRSPAEKIYGSLAGEAKDNLYSQAEKIFSPEDLAAFQGAKSQYAQLKPTFNEAAKLSKNHPDRLSVNLRSKLPGNFMGELAEKAPETKDEMKELFLNMLTQHSVSPRKFTKEIDYYGRDLLKNVMGDETFGALTAAEKRLHNAAQPFERAIKPTPIPYRPATPPELSMPEQYKGARNFLRGTAKTMDAVENSAPVRGAGRLFNTLQPAIAPEISNLKNKPTDLGEITVTPSDTGTEDMPLPESPRTIQTQLESVKDRKASAMLVTPGAEVPEVPQGLQSVDTPKGTWIYDPQKVSEDEILVKVQDGSYGELLGHLEPKQPGQGIVVAEQDGAEAKSSMVSPRNARNQISLFKKQFPRANVTYGGAGRVNDVLRRRMA